MKIRYNLIFIPLLIICAVAFWFIGFREQKDAAAKRLSDRSLVDLSRLEFVELRRGDETIRIEKAGSENPDGLDEWRMVSPYQAGCNPGKVTELLQEIMSAESERDIEGVSGDQLAEYGLDDPDMELKLISSTGEIMMDLDIGLENTSGSARYAMFSDKPSNVFLVPIYTVRAFEINASDLRDIRALAFDKDEVVSVRISSVETEFRLEKENGSWMVTVPDRFPASPARVDILLENIARLEVNEFLPENADDAELRETTVEVRVSAENGGENDLTLHGEDISRGIFVTSSWQPSPFIVESYIYDRLALDPSVFIQTQLIDIPEGQIARIHVRAPGSDNLEIERTGQGPEDWRIINPPDRSFTEDGDFAAFIESLLALQPEYVVSAPSHAGDYGIDPVYFMKIEVYREREMGEAIIKLGSIDQNGNYYATQDGTSYFTISSELVNNFIAAEQKLKGSSN